MPALALVAVLLAGVLAAAQQPARATVFEGARLIFDAGRAPIEDAVFVVEGDSITQAGRRADVRVPANAARVDLTGKTVMPAIIDAHGHMGYRKDASFLVENYTRENVIDHLQRLAYHGVAAVMSMGTERPEIGYPLRDELRRSPLADTALFYTAGQGLAMPQGGPSPPLRDTPLGVTTPDEARAAVRGLAARAIDGYVKIWVDDRNGEVIKLPRAVYAAAIDEAHKQGLKAITHTQQLADVKEILAAGIDGLAHPPWRGGQEADDELIALLEARPNVFVLMTLWSTRNDIFGRRPAWLDDPLVRETFTADDLRRLESTTVPVDAAARWKAGIVPRSVAKMKAAGVRFGLGDDAGLTNGAQYFGFAAHIELASMVEAGLTPAEALTAATRTNAEILGLTRLGTIAPGKSADFIVLDANPLDDINHTRRIARVYLRGQEVDRAALRAKWATPAS